MSPTLKKVLMIGGAVVAGYVVYTKVIKKSGKTLGVGARTIAASRVPAMTAQIKMSGNDEAVDGILEELGLVREGLRNLGTLGSK